VSVPTQVPELSVESLWGLLEDRRAGVLATIKSDGRPQLSNIGYAWNPETRVARIVAGDFRAKALNLRRDPRGSLHVTNDEFTLWLVAEGTVELSEVCKSPDDAIGHELIEMLRSLGPEVTDEQHEAFLVDYPIVDRLIIRLHVDRLYGGNASKALGISTS
jgi:PPOX class probable F420-dependent enzyme